MPITTHTIKKKSFELHTVSWGEGEKTLLAFHGYGQDSSIWKNFPDELTGHRIIAIDLFFHGKSHWQSKDPIQQPQWAEVISALIEAYQLQSFELIGFSMGTTLALATYSSYPELVDKVTLLSPDSIPRNPWFVFSTQNLIGQFLFRNFMKYPRPVLLALGFTMRLGLFDEKFGKWIQSQLEDDSERYRIYHSWSYFGKLYIPWKKRLALINAHTTPVTIVLGERDRVLPIDRTRPLAKDIDTHELIVLPSGHGQLVQAYLEHIQVS